MSKKESNPQPPGARPEPPPAPPGILTDNTEVIRALEQRVEELEEALDAYRGQVDRYGCESASLALLGGGE